jgi:hypothetical protein
MEPRHIGVSVVEFASADPYSIWQATRYRCPNTSCGTEVLMAFADLPLYWYDERFADALAAARKSGECYEVK